MRVTENTLYNLVGAAVPLLTTFLTLPAYLHAVGDARYGILAILWTMLSYFGLFDAGLGRATTHQIAQLGAAPAESRERVFWTALALNLTLGTVGALVLWAGGGLVLEHFVVAAAPLKDEVASSLGWVAFAVPVTTVAAVLGGALQGREKFLALNAMRIVDQVCNQLVPLAVALYWGPNLGWLVASAVLVRLVSALGSLVVCSRVIPLRHPPRLDRSRVPQLLSYGGWVTVTSIVSPLLVTLDRLIIGAVAGARAVAYYAVPYSLAYRIVLLPASLSSALFPKLVSGDVSERDRLVEEAVRAVVVLVTPLVLAGILIMKPFLGWWVGPDFAEQAAAPGQIIALGLWFNSFALIAFTRLQAQGQPDLVAKFHLLELGPYLLLLWFLVNAWGIVGAAVAWSVRVAVDSWLLFGATPVRAKLWRRLVTPWLMLAAGAAVAFLASRLGRVYWFVSMTLLSASLIWAWRSAPAAVRHFLERSGIARLRPQPHDGGQR